ncbi:hypothetical protein DPMN_176472, partial [Dreissena polymorpha]
MDIYTTAFKQHGSTQIKGFAVAKTIQILLSMVAATMKADRWQSNPNTPSSNAKIFKYH